VYSFGKNAFGSLGLGGLIFSPSPKRIIKLNNRKIVSVSCGLHHSLALSNIGDVYSWGRGYEGQLGLLKDMETASSPQYVSHFYKYDSSKETKMLRKTPIKFIACGASHSMAIDLNGTLYCWGEARFGQTGNGKKTKEPLPLAIKLPKN
jgi:RCC1 and BTB domain-containing protein